MLPGLMRGLFVKPGASMLDMINGAGAQSGLVMCLDAAVSASYPGTGQLWKDLSANTADFNLGQNTGADGTDPTFSGVPGRETANEYWSLNQDKYFSAPHAFTSNWHKNNAKLTIVAVVQRAPAGPIIANTIPVFGIGFSFDITSAVLGFYVYGGFSVPYSLEHSVLPPTNTWCFAGVALDEAVGSGGAVIQLNGIQQISSSAYSSPSGDAAAGALSIGTFFDPNDGPNTSRIACIAAWSRRLSNAELMSLYTQLRDRYPLA